MSQLSTNSSTRCAARFCRLGDGDAENAVASRVFLEAVMEAPRNKVSSNLVFVVDISGSMSGSAENAVRETLKTVQLQAPKSTRVITYNSVAAEMPLADYTARKNMSTGFTYFSAAFQAMTTMMLEPKNRGQDMTFVFMTDGEDTQNAPRLLEDSMQQFRIATQACRSVVTHVIGFGSVQAAFLEKVAATGSTAGTFRYASQVAELGAKFLDMYELSQSSVNCTVTIGTSPDPMKVELQGILVVVEAEEEEEEKDAINDFKALQKASHYRVEGLLPMNTTLTSGLDVTLSANGATMSCVLKCHGSASPLVKVKALEMCEVRNEADVTSIMETLSKIVPKGLSLVERMEMEEMRRSINDRLMQYLQVFNQMRLGQVNATSQLKLKDLRYEPHFSKVRRQRKVALRMNENMKMYSGIDERLQMLRKRLTAEDEAQLKQIAEQYSCALTLVDLHELMTESADDFMCLGVQISRDELILDCPNTGFRLKSVSSTIVSYNAFVDAMNKAIAEKGGKSAHGGFKVASKLDQYNPHEDKKADEDEAEDDEPYCVVGRAREKINAVVPLYLHKRHFERVLHLLPSWAGYFFALNPFAYEKNQEVAMFAMLGSMVMDHSGTAHYQQLLLQYAKVCAEVMKSSKNFKFACPPEKYTAFVETVKGRRTSQFPNLVTVFGMAFAKDVARCDDQCEVVSVLQPVYWEACKRLTMNRYAGSKLPAHAVAKELLYGDEASAAKQRALDADQSELPEEVKSVKAEIAFAAYFMDPASNAVPRIQLESKDENKEQEVVLKPLSTEALSEVIADRMEAVPNFIKTFYTKWMKFKHHEPEAVKGPDCNWDSLSALPFADKEVARRHLLLAYFYYNEYCPDHVNEDNILQVADEKFQTDQRNRDNNDARDQEEDVLAEVIAGASDLVAFGGMLRVYCPTRANKVFQAVVTRLVRNKDNEKMEALMRNTILNLPIYEGPLLSSVWRPSGFNQLRQIRDMLGKSVFERIEQEHRSNNHVLDWLYRISDKPNRCGHCNSNPWKGHRKPFASYAGVFS